MAVRKPIVAIVGRPNVGKSTLFNRVVGERLAIVDPTPGVTRDRLFASAEWAGRHFLLVDTGGLEPGEDDGFANLARGQTRLAMEQADLVLFVVDLHSGLTGADHEVVGLIRKSGKPIVVAANKADHPDQRDLALAFYELGLGEPVPISAEHGRGVGDLLDRVVASLPALDDELDDRLDIRLAVVGRPNVGKSSLVNRLLGEERVIVSHVPGTTRDAIDTALTFHGVPFTLIDTAGLRRRSRVDTAVEHYSVFRAIRAVERADVAAVVIDAVAGVSEQDRRIAGIPHEAGKGVMLVVNKWDLVEKDDQTMPRFEASLRDSLGFVDYAPSVYISARTGQRVSRVLETAHQVAEHASMRITTGRFNEWLRRTVAFRPPPTDKGRQLKVLYGHQVKVKPPTFVLFVNDPKLMHFSYRRYLENQLRAAYAFTGTPIHFILRHRRSP